MFSKTYKQKLNNTLKNSEKKSLSQRILGAFAAANEENVKELVPAKSSTSCMKLILHSGQTVSVYVVDGVPMMIDSGEQLIPTVCALWKVPNLIPTLTIHTPVLQKIQGGAPLYLPGVALPIHGEGFPMFARNALIAARTQDNAAAALVGRALLSSGDMLLRAAGQCLELFHVYGDLLTKEPKFNKLERPKLEPPVKESTEEDKVLISNMGQLNITHTAREEWPTLGKAPAPQVANVPCVIPDLPTPPDNPPESPDQDEPVSSVVDGEADGEREDRVPSDMDGLLRWTLLTFLKAEGKRLELPLKASLLYRNHLIPLCPEDRSLDVKKSTYKKISKFLEAMQKEGLLETREVEKGVEALVAFDAAHPWLKAHRPPPLNHHPPQHHHNQPHEEYAPPLVKEMFCITAHVVPLFAPLKKGTALSASEVRGLLTEYVKRHSPATHDKAAVLLDAALATALGRQPQESVKWDALMAGVQSRMTASTQMQFADGTVTLTKSKLEPVRMQVASRSGNKKVTLVSNLEPFGFNLNALSHVCQVGVAASCGVTRTPGSKGDQLMLQGDQTHFMAKLLIERYGLPKKFVEGADKALKKKK